MATALEKMKEVCIKNGITLIAMPIIGAGLDRLDWNKVSELICRIFDDMDIDILVCKLKLKEQY